VIVSSNDGSVNLIFFVKNGDQNSQGRSISFQDQVGMALKAIGNDDVDEIENLLIPSFKLETNEQPASEIQNLNLKELAKDSSPLFVTKASQSVSVELFAMPRSDGTPKI